MAGKTPYEVGYEHGEQGLGSKVPEGYGEYEARQYREGFNAGENAYRSRHTKSDNYGPYLTRRWIPGYGGYGTDEDDWYGGGSSPVPYIDSSWIPK